MNLRPLVAGDLDLVHSAFSEAFGDYAVPFRLTREQLADLLHRRGWAPEASVGVFDEERIVAFTLNGLGAWRGVRTGYDTGTGVVPSHRGRGLSRRMVDASLDLLRAQGAAQYLLEVLQSNERAIAVYRGAGFEVTRELQCWTLETADWPPSPRVAPVADVDWERVAGMVDVEPSWQNSIESVRRAPARKTVLAATEEGALAGVAVVFESGDLPLLAVERSARLRGIGRALLSAAARAAGAPLRILNVEGDYGSAFLLACGAARTVRQFEMLRGV